MPPLSKGTLYSLKVSSQHTAALQGSKLRLDSFLASEVSDTSRAKVQSSISDGLVRVNGKVQTKAAAALRPGDSIEIVLLPAPPMEAAPEAIPLAVVYEDEHLIVVDKPAGMVVHLSAGHYSGTLVNALLHYCDLPALQLPPVAPNAASQGEALFENSRSNDSGSRSLLPHNFKHMDQVSSLGHLVGNDDFDEDEEVEGWNDAETAALSAEPAAQLSKAAPGAASYLLGATTSGSNIRPKLSIKDDGRTEPLSARGLGHPALLASLGVRPGIVHRLDKGTTGLIVVAKHEAALRHLAAQFKARTVSRLYHSVTLGVPPQASGRVETNIVRDPRDRKRMSTAPYGSSKGRTAASNYKVLEVLAGGAAALVEWRLDTGRTHQIRVHAKHLGHPLLNDDTYGGGTASGIAVLAHGGGAAWQQRAKLLLADFGARPALHAHTLGFQHPLSGKRLDFCSVLPEDLRGLLAALRLWGRM